MPSTPSLSNEPPGQGVQVQSIVKIRRDYNSWVAHETMEDYALRYTPQRFRQWSLGRVANTAFGAASFLVLEAVGATLLIQYGFTNALWAILATGLIIFLAGLPISVYAARYGVDMDLLTRGAGFGYIGSTITSLIYASFTFIFFALEAAIMAYALELALDIPPHWGYLICALVVIPIVTHGVSSISRLQTWTQPVWLLLMVVPFVWIFWFEPGAFAGVLHLVGDKSQTGAFTWVGFGACMTVGVALMTQMGEQADYLRFMPRETRHNRWRWWLAVLAGGPGWVVLGVLKMIGGMLLAWLAISHFVTPDRAVDPNQMYLAAYDMMVPHHGWAVALTALLVVVSQLKINVTNAYAGSLAWSNFFSRLTHSHPGRVVWVVFNTLIAFMLMEMNLFQALGDVLGLYANVAIAWMMAVVADLVVNKPLGLSPPGIEFKRAHLYDINPVGVGAMLLASGVSVTAHLGVFGPLAQAFSALIALVTSMLGAVVLAWLTRGRYYLARTPDGPAQAMPPEQGAYMGQALLRCVICERDYETPDMAHCPAYRGSICSLCCTLDARCNDMCKPHARLSEQWSRTLRRFLPAQMEGYLETGLAHFLLLMLFIAPVLAAVLAPLVVTGFSKIYLAMLFIAGLVAWWVVLTHKSRLVAQEESNRQTQRLVREIELHQQTDAALKQARQVADNARHQAEQANQAKSRYISAISHELRTPLNSILGYAQLMGEDPALPRQRQHAVGVIRRSGEHLLSLIEGTLDMARIESGRLTLDVRPMAFVEGLEDLVAMVEPQARAKQLRFDFVRVGKLPQTVRADERRLRQILINLLGNAIQYTDRGGVTLKVRYGSEMANFEISDTGPGMGADELARVFEPFARGTLARQGSTGAGLGLTISRMLADLMGGELTVQSAPGVGTTFRLKLFAPRWEMGAAIAPPTDLETRWATEPAGKVRLGYEGARRHVLVVDNEETDRELMLQLLQPLGFVLRTASSGHDALDLLAAGYRPEALLMDLAMPGIDGWETLRRVRQMPGLQGLPVAIVSANAFEKGGDNDLGIGVHDFITKPVRHSELLQWLQRTLQLNWRYTEARNLEHVRPQAPASSRAASWSPALREREILLALRQAAAVGYCKGVTQLLTELARESPAATAWGESARILAGAFRFAELEQDIRALLEPLDSGGAAQEKKNGH